MLELLVAVRDILFALLMSWAGLGDDDSNNKPGEEARPQQTLSAPAVLR